MFKLDCWENKTVLEKNNIFGPLNISVPARFDFIGGWTDTPPYYFDNEACVLNTTLMLSSDNVAHPIEKAIQVNIDYADKTIITENNEKVEVLDAHLIIKKTFEFLHLDKSQLSLSISNSIPKGSGLGGSSLLVASILASLWGYYKGINYVVENLHELINNVLLIEQLMESGGGWQDQIGGLFPGIKLIETLPGKPCNYSISYLENSSKQLNSNSLIIDTRIQRKATRILYSIRQKYIDNDPKTVAMLAHIAANAKIGFTLLKENNLKDFAELLSESWQMVNEVESGSSIETVDIIKKLCGKDLIGIKIGGAGGGGFILTIFQDEERKEYYRGVIKKNFPDCIIYNPIFGGSGMSLYQNESRNVNERYEHHIGKINYV